MTKCKRLHFIAGCSLRPSCSSPYCRDRTISVEMGSEGSVRAETPLGESKGETTAIGLLAATIRLLQPGGGQAGSL